MGDKNYDVIGKLHSIDELRKLVETEDFSRSTIRETTIIEEGRENAQRETNIIPGVYDMFEEIPGVCNNDMMDRYEPFVDEIVEVLKKRYNYKSVFIKSFCLIRLAAGNKIYPHRDDEAIELNAYYDFCKRIHVPVITNKDVVFTIGGESKHLEYGDIIEIDNLKEHSVVNNGNTDRVHLLIDFYGTKSYYNRSLMEVPDEFYTN